MVTQNEEKPVRVESSLSLKMKGRYSINIFHHLYKNNEFYFSTLLFYPRGIPSRCLCDCP